MAIELPPGVWLRLSIWFYKLSRKVRSALVFLGIKNHMGWAEFDIAIRCVAFRASRYNPDVVIGVGVGGAIVATILAGNLNRPFICIDRDVEWDSDRNVTLADASVTASRKRLIEGKRALLVSAEVRSGQTTDELRKYVNKMKPTETKVCCIDANPHRNIDVDYYFTESEKVIQKPWRILPSYVNPDDLTRPST